jgi:hypothetical protein
MKVFDFLHRRNKENPLDDGNPALVRSMHEVALSDNPETRKNLYQALLASMLLIPVPEIPAGLKTGLHQLQPGVQLQLLRLIDTNQVPITPAFTDLEALRNWDPNTPYIGLKAIDFFRVVLGTDIQDVLINPFDPIRKMIRPGGRVKRGELEILAAGQIPAAVGLQTTPIKQEEKVLVGLPANPPSPEIQELLRGKAWQIPAVSELYFFQMARGQSSNTVIGVGLTHEADEAQKQEIARALGSVIRRELTPGQLLDFIFLSEPLGEQIRKIGGLVFRRS